MKADKLERIARAQAKALRATLKLFSEVDYLDSYGQALEGKLDVWLDQEQLTPIYIDYKVGHLYSHAGLIQHRISKVGEVTDENPRITLQGHGAILDMSNKAVVYF